MVCDMKILLVIHIIRCITMIHTYIITLIIATHVAKHDTEVCVPLRLNT